MEPTSSADRDFQVLVTVELGNTDSRAEQLAAFKSSLESDQFNEVSDVKVEEVPESNDIDLSFTLKARSNPEAQRLVNTLMTKLASATSKMLSDEVEPQSEYEEVGRGLRPWRPLAAV